MKILITGGSGFIGTNFIELLESKGLKDILNIDKARPLNSEQDKYWAECNIMSRDELLKVFQQYEPTHVVHLAAKTDTASENLEDYFENTNGTANVLYAIERTQSVKHTVITSTQYVYKSNSKPLPDNDEDFKPHTAYGISKKITEELTRKSQMKCRWTIIRPTNVWGPWNMRYPNELLKVIDRGLYFHPGKVNPVKSYAYVKNVAHQIMGILTAPEDITHRQVYYVGDYPMSSLSWLNSFSRELKGGEVKSFPLSFLRLLSYAGDILKKMGIPFPLHSLRFKNMIDGYLTPMDKTISSFGLSHPDQQKNVHETITWARTANSPMLNYWKNK
ncbi:NAD-dependent epimerase/dehydratase family protein [Pedobacter faecalis]|uniref:NAD-dependent epimerase/dehydratase family protein n=1 Tax=Pedobacter faecalis TaxID=3041495 RepID=UPI00254A2F65|nr:NAD(P)-dependent oxidoreductase [Pedobacter sp. ELA7]